MRQYSLYNAVGELDENDNIANNGGLKLAYETWKARYDSDEANERRYHNFYYLSYSVVWLTVFSIF